MNRSRAGTVLLAAAALAAAGVASAQAPESAAGVASAQDGEPAAEAASAEPADTAAAAAPAPAADSGAPADRPYTVECSEDPAEGGTVCLVDRGTYIGWRTFHAICHTCHAQDAVGSTFAPNLLERMRVIDKAEFMKAMNEGFTGQMGVMPPWKQDPNVNKYFEELWSYLLARADGKLPPGRPKRLPEQP